MMAGSCHLHVTNNSKAPEYYLTSPNQLVPWIVMHLVHCTLNFSSVPCSLTPTLTLKGYSSPAKEDQGKIHALENISVEPAIDMAQTQASPRIEAVVATSRWRMLPSAIMMSHGRWAFASFIDALF
jgi:hypothetical protein